MPIYRKVLGLMFGRKTSTSTGAMIGGMIGNNSCGLLYNLGSCRIVCCQVKVYYQWRRSCIYRFDRTIWEAKYGLQTLERKLQAVHTLISNRKTGSLTKRFSTVPLNNTGYALDYIAPYIRFKHNKPFNLNQINCRVSRGTLCFIAEQS